MCRSLEWRGNTREVFNFSAACLCIQAFYIPAFAFLNGCTDVHFQKIILPDNIRRHFADVVAGTDKGCNRYNARIYKQFGNLGYTADVLYAVGFRKAQIVIDAAADIVSVQNTAKQSAFMQLTFQSDSYRTLTRPAQPGKPNHHAMLFQKLFFVLPRQHSVKNRIYIIFCHNSIKMAILRE